MTSDLEHRKLQNVPIVSQSLWGHMPACFVPIAQCFAQLVAFYVCIDFIAEGEKWKNKPINTTTLGKSFIYSGYLFSP